jgi:pimeloyl-ACP methyl ester carboxylesterase
MGESSRPEKGYDAGTMADDIGAQMASLHVQRYTVVGHDIGMWIAYALAAKYERAVDKLVMSEALIPGISPMPPLLQTSDKNLGLSQYVFNQLRDIPELLVAGREAEYVRWHFQQRAYYADRVAVEEYVRAYSVPGAMKAGFEYYRAIPLTMHQNQEFKKRKLGMPVLAIGAAFGAGENGRNGEGCGGSRGEHDHRTIRTLHPRRTPK